MHPTYRIKKKNKQILFKIKPRIKQIKHLWRLTFLHILKIQPSVITILHTLIIDRTCATHTSTNPRKHTSTFKKRPTYKT